MKTLITTMGLAACLIAVAPISSFAAPTKAKKPAAAQTTYECNKCHMKVSAATAKKDHYKDPMDGGTLVPVKAAPKSNGTAKAKSSSMKSMGM